ncbi:MAG: hypothetical protein QW215_02345 [Ignisphaera sp.]
MAKYLPAQISDVVKETGAHPMCILRKIVTRGLRWPVPVDQLRAVANECVAEGKQVPVLKYLRQAGIIG